MEITDHVINGNNCFVMLTNNIDNIFIDYLLMITRVTVKVSLKNISLTAFITRVDFVLCDLVTIKYKTQLLLLQETKIRLQSSFQYIYYSLIKSCKIFALHGWITYCLPAMLSPLDYYRVA